MTDGVGRTDDRTDTDCPEGETPPLPDPQDLARDWITLWQSELTALAADREMRENWQAAVGFWADLASSILRDMPSSRGSPSPHDTASQSAGSRHAAPQHGGPRNAATRPAGTDDATRTAAPAAASDARDAEIERLDRHVAALEARLVALEHGNPLGGPLRRRRKRKL